jgi:glycosyltransferase involved in cell wall biosynthesis
MANIFMANYTSYRRENRGRRSAEALATVGHRVVYLACQEPGGPYKETVAGVEVLAYPLRKKKPDSAREYIVEYVKFFLIIFLHLTLHPLRYDLIHICNMPDFLTLGALMPRILGRPVIHDVHDIMPDIYQNKFNVAQTQWVVRILRVQLWMAARFASHILVADPNQKHRVMSVGIPRQKITIILNLPDERIFAPRQPLPLKGPDEPFVMVYHGTLSHRLGLDVAIRAVAKLSSRIQNLRFRVIGGGEELEKLIKLHEVLKLQRIVWFSMGYVPLEEIPDLICDADIAVVPLRDIVATETMLPVKLMEYAFVGIPVVVTKTSLIQQFFDDTMVRFAESDNVDSFAEAIYDMYNHQDKRVQYWRRCKEKFTERYRWAEHKRCYFSIVNRLLGLKAN